MSLLTYLILIYIIIFLFLLVKIKIIQPINIIRKNKVEKVFYYREELNDYSPLIYAKLLGKDIYNSDSIIAMILYLRNKGWNQNDNNVDDMKVMDHEKFFIEKSKFIFGDLYSNENSHYNNKTLKQALEDFVEEDMKKEGILKTKYSKKRVEIIDFITWIFFIANGIFLAEISEKLKGNSIIILQIIEGIINLIWITTYFINLQFKLFFIQNLDKKGSQYLAKLKASKRYLKEYSLVADRKIENEIVLGAYIRNAIFFNLKGNLDKDSEEYYKNIISLYGYKDYKNNIEYKEKIYTIIIFIVTLLPWFFIFFMGDFTMKMILASFIVNPLIFLVFMGKRLFFK